MVSSGGTRDRRQNQTFVKFSGHIDRHTQRRAIEPVAFPFVCRGKSKTPESTSFGMEPGGDLGGSEPAY